MSLTPEVSARQLLEVVPAVMRDIRSQMRSRRSPDLTVPQFRTLGFLDRNEGASLSDVARHMGLTPPSTSHLVDGLIARGLVAREGHPVDRRRVRLTITRSGLSILEASRRGTLAYLAGKLSGVSDDEREAIVRAMETLRTVFAAGAARQTVVK
ncbi:MAG: MarR family transcriptional regulator [Conexivisphaerales archaeon]